MKTYSHLPKRKSPPSDYEIGSSRLHYYTEKGFEIRSPLQEWYDKYQKGSLLQCSADAWEKFNDPSELTYARYTEIRHAGENFIDGLLEKIDASQGKRPESLNTFLAACYGPCVYAFHGFQMVSSYFGQMAPSGKISIVALMQGADEIRKIQRVAHRLARIGVSEEALKEQARRSWQENKAWQPLRKTLEHLLVAYDWGEALVGLNLCLKPAIDELFLKTLLPMLRKKGDALFADILAALDADSRWQREWTASLLETAFAANPRNRGVVDSWTEKWRGSSLEAVQSIRKFLEKEHA